MSLINRHSGPSEKRQIWCLCNRRGYQKTVLFAQNSSYHRTSDCQSVFASITEGSPVNSNGLFHYFCAHIACRREHEQHETFVHLFWPAEISPLTPAIRSHWFLWAAVLFCMHAWLRLAVLYKLHMLWLYFYLPLHGMGCVRSHRTFAYDEKNVHSRVLTWVKVPVYKLNMIYCMNIDLLFESCAACSRKFRTVTFRQTCVDLNLPTSHHSAGPLDHPPPLPLSISNQ